MSQNYVQNFVTADCRFY